MKHAVGSIYKVMGQKGIRAALTCVSPVVGNSTEKFTQPHAQRSFTAAVVLGSSAGAGTVNFTKSTDPRLSHTPSPAMTLHGQFSYWW